MSDSTRTTPPSKQTVEIYRDLLQVEVRALISRVSELTSTVGDLFVEVNGIAIQLEESVHKVDRVTGGLDYCREELGAIRKSIGKYEATVEAIKQKVDDSERQLVLIQEQLRTDADV